MRHLLVPGLFSVVIASACSESSPHRGSPDASPGGGSDGAAHGSDGVSGDAGPTGSGDGAMDDAGSTGMVGPVVEPGDPGAADVHVDVDSTLEAHRISAYVYGTQNFWVPSGVPFPLVRAGGNRWTAYNWESNASNAGTDYGPNSNDGYLSDSSSPGAAIASFVDATHASGAAALVTVPIQGKVAADKSGVVTSGDAASRFLPSLPKKSGALSLTPDTSDGSVYEDELVHFVESKYEAAAQPVSYSLDNEPDLWASTHPLIQTTPLTYAGFMEQSLAFARAIRSQAPNAWITGPVSYGFNGFVNLQNAADANGRDFLAFYLDAMKAASDRDGARLLDLLDVHWYSEATGGGVRIQGSEYVLSDEQETSPALVAARLDAPRELADDTWTEQASWIQDFVGHDKPIRILGYLKERIDQHFSGTGLAITEYDYGAGFHISGAIAQADALGIFGREGVRMACVWPVKGDADHNEFRAGAFRMFLDYDGAGGHFGDVSVQATTDDRARTSVYAAYDHSDTKRITLVVINRSDAPLTFALRVRHSAVSTAHAYQLTSASSTPTASADIPVTKNALTYEAPALSVSTLVLE